MLIDDGCGIHKLPPCASKDFIGRCQLTWVSLIAVIVLSDPSSSSPPPPSSREASTFSSASSSDPSRLCHRPFTQFSHLATSHAACMWWDLLFSSSLLEFLKNLSIWPYQEPAGKQWHWRCLTSSHAFCCRVCSFFFPSGITWSTFWHEFIF